jgi:hypothetical protein
LQLNIRTSKTMDDEEKRSPENEHRIIRLPINLRIALNLSVGNYLNLKDIAGNVLTLQVSDCYAIDAKIDEYCGFVTTKNYNRLFITQHANDTTSGRIRRVEGITLGCDPEVFLVNRNTGKVIVAHKFFRKYGQVGHDGMLLEFRPNYSTDEETLTHNIYGLIKRARGDLNHFEEGRQALILGASSIGGLTAGFHLHFGLPYKLQNKNNKKLHVMAGVITKVLDYYVGIPAIAQEGNDDVARRTLPYVEYGKPGGYRLSKRTFEFRLPGGICMAHPILTKGLITLGSVVMEDLVSRLSVCTNGFEELSKMLTEQKFREVYPELPDTSTMYGLICNSRIEPALNRIDRILETLQQMVGYKHNNRDVALENFFNCIYNGTKFSKNIEENWRNYYNEERSGSLEVLQPSWPPSTVG